MSKSYHNYWGTCQKYRCLDYMPKLQNQNVRASCAIPLTPPPPPPTPDLMTYTNSDTNRSLRATAQDHSSGEWGDGILDKRRRGVLASAEEELVLKGVWCEDSTGDSSVSFLLSSEKGNTSSVFFRVA